ncbi:MAG TPA: 3-isopropylmalate dehydrogenase [Candidatus Limnocylindrales bacterium]|nr:3-isopropylmalate dehydrogenase [Candidatus Limnocylindrales bacterium]
MTTDAAPRYRITAIPGDGVGPEVVGAARAVLDAAADAFGFAVEWTELLAGGAAIDTYGVAIRAEDVEAGGAADAILLGAVGGPKWDDPNAAVRPEQALFALRGGLELFANLRPVSVHPALVPSSPLRPELLEGVDLLIVRELTSGLYFGRPSEERATADGRVAVDTLWYSEAEIRRVVRVAFELARGRRSKVTSVDKANVLATSRLWRKVVEEVRVDFPEVAVGHQLVDSCAMLLVRQPAAFDVIVTENLFGDILSDEAAVLAGSLGMLPSASLGDRRTAHGRFGLYEPIHGSAPDIAGRDLANPLGTILSAAMLVRWSLGQEAAAAAIEAAVSSALDDGFRTRDLVPPAHEGEGLRVVGTTGMRDAVVERLRRPSGAGRSRDAGVDEDLATIVAADTLLGLP